MDYLNAFWVGGLICALVQILMEKTKLLPGRIMVLLVCSGAVLSALGWYQPFVDFAGAGGERAAAWLWAYVDEGRKRSGGTRRISRVVYGRLSGRGCRNCGGADFRISGEPCF